MMFFNKGSLFQLVTCIALALAFSMVVGWYQPYSSRAANLFKVGTEAALLLTLYLVVRDLSVRLSENEAHSNQDAVQVLLKIDLSREDIPGGEDFVGFLLILANTAVPVRNHPFCLHATVCATLL